jgi:hypothetical protein
MDIKLVKTSFKLSQIKYLSKIEWCLHGHTFENPIPKFNVNGFNRDLKGLALHSKTLHDLKVNVIGISDEYIFPPATFTLLLKQKDKMIVSGQKERRFLTENDIGMHDPKSFYMYVRATGKSVYIPKVNFSNCHGFYQLPEDVAAKLAKEETVHIEGVKEVTKMGINYVSLDENKKISEHSWSMMLLPITSSKEDIGMMVFTYRPPFIFDDRDSEGNGILGSEYLIWNKMLAEMTSFTLQKLAKLGQKYG